MSKYVKISLAAIPPGVRFDTPRRLQGQHIEISYGGFGRYGHGVGDPYKRVIDHSDKTETYYQLVDEGE